MNVITDTLRQLVRRKLWPVALLLVGGAGRRAADAGQGARAARRHRARRERGEQDEGLPATFVSVAEDGEVTERRRVLGADEGPVRAGPAAQEVQEGQEGRGATEEPQPEATEAPQAAGTAGGGAPASEPPVSDAAGARSRPYPQYSIKVRFGKTDGELETKTLERLDGPAVGRGARCSSTAASRTAARSRSSSSPATVDRPGRRQVRADAGGLPDAQAARRRDRVPRRSRAPARTPTPSTSSTS